MDVEKTLMRKTSFVFHRMLRKINRSQCVDVVAFSKIASTDDDHLETEVCSVSCGMETIDRHEILRGLSVGIFPILVRCNVCFFMSLISQIKSKS
jgi:hypothetical protein